MVVEQNIAMKSLLFTVVLFTLSINVFAQHQLYPVVEQYSHKKPAYLTLSDGSEVEGTIKDVDRKKGLIEEITLEVRGKKKKFLPKDLQSAYLPPSGLAKFLDAMDFINDPHQWVNRDLDQHKLAEGYVYLEMSEVMIKKKKMTLMLQLLNPTFSNRIKIYNDPFAKESFQVNVAGFKAAGGHEKSYYVKKGDEVAYRFYKKDYKEQFFDLFKDCENLIEKHKEDLYWPRFSRHTYEYSTDCK